MKHILIPFLAVMLTLSPVPVLAAKIQKQGIKTEAECIAAGATAANCLPEDTQVYVTANGLAKKLSSAITDGDIGGSSGLAKNNLTNPSAVGNADNWTATGGGTFARTTTSGEFRSSPGGFSFDASAAADKVTSNSWAVPSGANQAAVGICHFVGAATDYKFEVYDGTNVVTSQVVAAHTTFQKYELPFLAYGGSSYSLRVYAQSNAVEIDWDDCYLGENVGLTNVSQASLFGTAIQDGAAGGTCVFTENTSTALNNFVTLGTGTGCNAWTTTGNIGVTGTNSHSITIAQMPPGEYLFDISAGFQSDTASQGCVYRITDGTVGLSDASFAVDNGAYGGSLPHLQGLYSVTTTQTSKTFSVQAADDGAGICRIANGSAGPKFVWKVWKYPTSSQLAVTADDSSWYVDATMDGAAPSLGTSAVSSYTELSNASLTLKPQSGSAPVGVMCSSTNAATAPSTGNTTCAAGSESVGINFSVPKAGVYEVCAASSHYIEGDSSEAAIAVFQLIETPTNAQTLTLEGGTRTVSGLSLGTTVGTSHANSNPLHSCSLFNWASNGIKGVRLMYTQSVGAGTINVSGLSMDGSGGSAGGRNLRWTVRPWTGQSAAPIHIGSVTSNSSGAERVERVYVTNSGTPTISAQSGNWVSSLTDGGVGITTVNFAAGIFSGRPQCVVSQSGGGGTNVCYPGTATSSSSVFIVCKDNTDATADRDFDMICMGPR